MHRPLRPVGAQQRVLLPSHSSEPRGDEVVGEGWVPDGSVAIIARSVSCCMLACVFCGRRTGSRGARHPSRGRLRDGRKKEALLAKR
eukprot:760359-Hanusia_phi.AAC.4